MSIALPIKFDKSELRVRPRGGRSARIKYYDAKRQELRIRIKNENDDLWCDLELPLVQIRDWLNSEAELELSWRDIDVDVLK